jgi:hypothetical protein
MQMVALVILLLAAAAVALLGTVAETFGTDWPDPFAEGRDRRTGGW